MIVGVPKEIKDQEYRVALTAGGAKAFTSRGHKVLVQKSAGEGSGLSDQEYQAAGAELVDTPQEIFKRADLVLKVKEPAGLEPEMLREGQILLTFLHLAANEHLTRKLMRSGAVGIAGETVQKADGSLPILEPMSEVAGRLAVQVGAQYLEKFRGGKGILLGGVPGVPPGTVVILGGGIVGTNAAKIAVGLGARVIILNRSAERLRYLDDIFGGRVETVVLNEASIEAAVEEADLLVGAILVPGAKAPKLVKRGMVREMAPGSVIVDVAIDQGGCIETSRPTTHSHPTYVEEGVIHYCVTNMPGIVPRTSTFTYANVTLPYALELADKGYRRAAEDDPALAKGFNVVAGRIVHGPVAEALGLPSYSLEEALGSN